MNKEKSKNLLLFKEIIRYLIVGGLATIVDYGIFAMLYYGFKLDTDTLKLVDNGIAFIAGLLFNYFLSIVFVFKDASKANAGKSIKDFLIFAIVGVIGLAISEVGLYLAGFIYFKIDGQFIVLNVMLAKIILTGIVLIWNYLGRKTLIFR